MTVEGQYSSCTVSNNLSATITNININGSVNYSANNKHNHRHVENGSVNSSMSSSSSSCSIAQQNTNLQMNKLACTNRNSQLNTTRSKSGSEETCGVVGVGTSGEIDDYEVGKEDDTGIFVRIAITDQNVQVRVVSCGQT